MKNNHGNGDLMKWMTRFQIDGRRLEESWLDLWRTAHNNAQAALVAADDTHVVQPWTDEMQQAVYYDEAFRLHRQAHRDLFSHFLQIWFLWFSSQRQIYLKIKDRVWQVSCHIETMDQYRVNELRETFIEMSCTVKTAVDNPMMNSIRIWWKKNIFSIWWRRPRG